MFKPSQVARLDSWLRRRHPGSKPATWLREVALSAMDADEPASADAIKLHLVKEDREKIMEAARELGHRDLAIFTEELLLRLAKRSPDEIVDIFRGKPCLSLVPPMPAPSAAESAPTVPMSDAEASAATIAEMERLMSKLRRSAAQEQAEEQAAQERSA